MSTSAQVPSPSVLDTMTRIIISQTDMTEEEIKIALEKTNYDLKRVIREYMRGDTASNTIETQTNNNNNSTNQLRFTEIRNFMDKSASQYYQRQEMTRIYNQVLERKKADAVSVAAAASSLSSALSDNDIHRDEQLSNIMTTSDDVEQTETVSKL